MPLPFFHHRCCYIVGLLVVLVTLLSIADAWKEMLIPCQNGSIDLKDCIMPFKMHCALLPFQQGRLLEMYCRVPLLLPIMKFPVQIQTFCTSIILAFSGAVFLYWPFIKQIRLIIWPAQPWWWVGWAFPSLNHCQGLLQTSRSVTVALCYDECLCSQYWLPLLHCYVILSFQLSAIYLAQSLSGFS